MHYPFLKDQTNQKKNVFFTLPELKLLSVVFDVEGGDDLSISCKIFGMGCVDVND
jgi:hypothetical protein